MACAIAADHQLPCLLADCCGAPRGSSPWSTGWIINSLDLHDEDPSGALSTMGDYTSWESLRDRTFSQRHLPPDPDLVRDDNRRWTRSPHCSRRPDGRTTSLREILPALSAVRAVVRRRIPAHRSWHPQAEHLHPRHRPEPAVRPDRRSDRHASGELTACSRRPAHRRPRVPALLLRRGRRGRGALRESADRPDGQGPENQGRHARHPRSLKRNLFRAGHPAREHPLRLRDDEHAVPSGTQPHRTRDQDSSTGTGPRTGSSRPRATRSSWC